MEGVLMILKRWFLLTMLFSVLSIALYSQSEKQKIENRALLQGYGIESVREVSETEEQKFILDRTVVPEEYIVGPGDEFYIFIFTNEMMEFKVNVNPVGDLVIPGIGKVPVSEKSLSEVVKLISDFIREKGVRKGLVSVSLSNIRKFKVLVLGAVRSPGFYVVDPVTRVSELIESAGGFLQLAKLHQIQVYRNGVPVDTLNFVNFLVHGNLRDNPYLHEREIVYVPFGDVAEEGIQLRGAVVDCGYCIIEPGETLGNLLKRKGALKDNAQLDHVWVIRNEKNGKRFYKVKANEFDNWVLKAGDEVDVVKIKGVYVVGYVNQPGIIYDYLPGLKAWDYISLAGGISEKGSFKKIVVIHENGRKEKGRDVVIKRGDIIMVGRSNKDILLGEESSVLEVTVSLVSVLLAYLAASRYTR